MQGPRFEYETHKRILELLPSLSDLQELVHIIKLSFVKKCQVVGAAETITVNVEHSNYHWIKNSSKKVWLVIGMGFQFTKVCVFRISYANVIRVQNFIGR